MSQPSDSRPVEFVTDALVRPRSSEYLSAEGRGEGQLVAIGLRAIEAFSTEGLMSAVECEIGSICGKSRVNQSALRSEFIHSSE